MGDLPEVWRTIFEWCEKEGFTPGEVMEALRAVQAQKEESKNHKQLELPLGTLSSVSQGRIS